jgi:hypothetical protein
MKKQLLCIEELGKSLLNINQNDEGLRIYIIIIIIQNDGYHT